MGKVQTAVKDREKTALFALPWRESSKAARQDPEAEDRMPTTP